MGDARRRKLARIRNPFLRWLIIVGLIAVVCVVGFVPYFIAHLDWLPPSGRSLLLGTLLLAVGIDMVQASRRMSLGLGWLFQGILATAGGTLLLLSAFGFI
jgi:hypothetical protein